MNNFEHQQRQEATIEEGKFDEMSVAVVTVLVVFPCVIVSKSGASLHAACATQLTVSMSKGEHEYASDVWEFFVVRLLLHMCVLYACAECMYACVLLLHVCSLCACACSPCAVAYARSYFCFVCSLVLFRCMLMFGPASQHEVPVCLP